MRLGLCGRLAPGVLLFLTAAGTASAQEGGALPDTLDIERALSIAMSRSPQLSQAQAATDQARANRTAAWGAFLPTAGVNMNLNRNNFTTNSFLSPEGESQELPDPLTSSRQSGSQGLNVSWTVFDLQRIANYRERGEALTASQRRQDDQRLAVIADVRRRYVEALRRQTLLELTRQQIVDRETELDIAQRRYEIGAVELSDVLAAETLLLNAEVTLLSETSQLETGLQALSVSLGMQADEGPGTLLVDITELPDAEMLRAGELVAYALSEDPEIQAYQADQAAANATLWGARSRFLPTIQLGFNLGRSEQFGPGSDFFQFDFTNTSRTFSVTASWQLFDGFSRTSQTRAASAQRFQASESLRQRRLEIEREVRRFLKEIDQFSQALVLLERALQISQERLRMTRLQYQNSTANFTTLQQAISTVTNAERQLIEQRYAYLNAWTNLEEYVGDVR
jgi:multidrug efflux system outer membrane protein